MTRTGGACAALTALCRSLREKALAVPDVAAMGHHAPAVGRLVQEGEKFLPAGEQGQRLFGALADCAIALDCCRADLPGPTVERSVLAAWIAGDRRRRLVAALDAALDLLRLWERDEW